MWSNSRAIISGMIMLTLAVILSACGPSESATTAADTNSPTAEVSLLEKLLATIPDTPDTRRSVFINDYAAVREIFEVPLPGPDAGEPAFLEYFKALVGPDARMFEVDPVFQTTG